MKTQEFNSANTPKKKFSGVEPENNPIKSGRATSPRLMRWRWLYPLAFAGVLYSCNNDQLVQKYKTLHLHDSALMVQTLTDDSTIRGYINNLNDIQSNLDEIKEREKILSVKGQGETKTGNTAIEDIKAIDNLIIKSNREVAALHLKIKKMKVKDAEMETMIARMTTQLAEKDTEIAVLQGSLARVNTSYTEITRQFNDSITMLQAQNARIAAMTNAMNTVYYAIGTVKELKANKVIAKAGGFIGIGQNVAVQPDLSSSYFTKTDLTKLAVVPLNAKFKKLLSTHPVQSYKITGNKTADSLWITNPSSFWSEDKYLVIAVK